MSKNVLKTLLVIDFKATGKGRRFQYATYGPPAPAEGRTIKEYAVRLALDTQTVTGEAPSHLPPLLLHSMELTFALTVCSSLSNDMTSTQKPAVGTAMLSNYIFCPPVIHVADAIAHSPLCRSQVDTFLLVDISSTQLKTLELHIPDSIKV